MKILIVHNCYINRGGEESAVEADIAILKKNGHEVDVYYRENVEIVKSSLLGKINHLLQLSWSRQTYQDIKSKISTFKPDLVHCHNIFYLVTPAVYDACREMNVPVVQSLHNYRLFIPSGLLFPNTPVVAGDPQKTLWKSIGQRSFKNSHLLTFLLVGMLSKHWKQKTWQTKVNAFIALTQFAKQQFVEMSLPAEKVFVKPNAISHKDDCKVQPMGNYYAYIGRISEEKGIKVLIEAWKNDYPLLRVIGDGPLLDEIRMLIKKNDLKNVELCRHLPKEQLEPVLACARCVIVPSICYENFPMIIAEAFAYGVPVLASRLGSHLEIISEGKTGWLFDVDDIGSVRKKLEQVFNDEGQLERMRQTVYKEYESKYSDKSSYKNLIGIYAKVMNA